MDFREWVDSCIKTHRVVVLTGPRQVGKSTLLENAAFLKAWRYLTLDDPDVLEQAKEDPFEENTGDKNICVQNDSH